MRQIVGNLTKKGTNIMSKPTVLTPEVVGILVQSFQDGLNVTQACWQAGIGRDAYYDRCKADPAFADKMNRAQNFLSMNARKNVMHAIKKGDMKTSRWLLERKNKDEFSSRTEVTGKDGAKLIDGVEPEARERLDNILARKNGANGSNQPTGDDRPDDSGGGGDADQSVSS